MFGVPLHFLLVHFPIAFALLAVACDLRAHFGNVPELHETGYRLTVWAGVAAACAVLSGLQMGKGRFESSESIAHVGSALIAALCLIALTVFRYSAKARQEEGQDSYSTAWLLLGLFAALAIAVAAITGHRFALGN